MPSIQDFKAYMQLGGARNNQFRASIFFPALAGAADFRAVEFLCKAASLPSSNVGDVLTHYRGHEVHFAGERTFEPWTVTIYNDNDFSLRDAFERWSQAIMHHSETNGVLRPADYQVPMTVEQLDRNNGVVKVYEFRDAYPTVIGQIQLDFDQNNVIETFDVTMVYNYWLSNTTPEI